MQCEATAVTILHGRQQPAAGVVHLQPDLRDPWEPLAQLVSIVRTIGADLVEIDLLVKGHVLRRALTDLIAT